MIATLRRGGVIGIIGVVLMVGATILSVYVDETSTPHINPYGVIIVPGYTVGLHDLPTETADRFDKFLPFWGLIAAPLCFLFTLDALSEWLRQDEHPLARWLHSIGLLSMGCWLLAGIIRITIVPQTGLTPLLFWLQLSSGLYEGAYLLMAFHALALAFVFKDYKLWLPAGLNMMAGTILLLVLMLSPYEKINLFNMLGYGLPIIRMFWLSILLLLQAERFARLITL